MSSYHGWTHLPKAQGGTDPIPIPEFIVPPLPWGFRYSPNTQTVPDSTITPIEFLSSGSAFQGVSDTADIEILNDSGQYGFDPHLSGFWRLRLVVYWDADPAYSGNVLINNNPTEVIDAMSGRLIPGNNPISFEMVWPQPARTGSDAQVFPYFIQYSGVDRDVFGAMFTAIYLGSYDNNPVGVS